MLTVGRYFKQRFGEKVRKIPISLSGFTCPNIDGKVAKGGCIYCKNETFSPSLVMKKKQNSNIDSNNTESTQEQNIKDITKLKMNFSLTENPLLPTQLRELETQFHYHANFHKNKYGIKKYMVYFQSFTNTYAPFDTLKALYTKALKLPDVVGMSIGTRVDCVDSLKIHPLYVVEGTALARMYKKGEYTPISLEDYGEAIAKSLKLIPPNIVIQRVSAGAHDESLIAPKWCFDKNIQMRYLRDRLKKEGIDY